jgi:hypothetical protein
MLGMGTTDSWPEIYAVRQGRDGTWLSYTPPADPGCPPLEVELRMPAHWHASKPSDAIPFVLSIIGLAHQHPKTLHY